MVGREAVGVGGEKLAPGRHIEYTIKETTVRGGGAWERKRRRVTRHSPRERSVVGCFVADVCKSD